MNMDFNDLLALVEHVNDQYDGYQPNPHIGLAKMPREEFVQGYANDLVLIWQERHRECREAIRARSGLIHFSVTPPRVANKRAIREAERAGEGVDGAA